MPDIALMIFGFIVVISTVISIHRWGILAGLIVGLLMVGAYVALGVALRQI